MPITFSARGAGMRVDASKAGASLKNPNDFLSADDFAVFGTWTVDNGTSANIFTKQVVSGTWNSTTNQFDCSYSPLRYWQKSGVYSFRAVYPHNVTTTSSSNAASLVINYSMSTQNYDLMVANSDARNLTLTHNTDPVPLNFRHACAAVSFKFQKGSQASSVNYYIEDFELKYLLSVGSLVFTSTDQDAPIDDQWWVSEDFRSSSLYKWTGKIPVPASYSNFPGNGTTWEEWHCVIPQSMAITSWAEGRPQVRFASSIKTGTNTYTTPAYTTIDLPDTYTYTDELGTHTEPVVWEAGKKYVYYIQIQPGGADIYVTTTDWDPYKVAVEDLMF